MPNISFFIKNTLKKIIYKYQHLPVKVTVNCSKKWYGNNYGGFYVNPDFITKDSIIYSFGVGEDISFDEALIKEFNCSVYGFDPTPKSINWIRNRETPQGYHFFEYGLNNTTGTVDFYLPKNVEYVSGSHLIQDAVDSNRKITVPMKSIEDIHKELKHKKISVLKMDIEGSEYDVIDSILSLNIEINQILIEFHDRFFRNGSRKTNQVIRKLAKAKYKIFAISDSKEEISFIRQS